MIIRIHRIVKTDSKQNAFAKLDPFLRDQERRQYNERNQIWHIVDYKQIYILDNQM